MNTYSTTHNPMQPAIHPDLEQILLSLVNTQSVLIDAEAKQAALIQAICDQYGDQIPLLYQLLQSIEGNREVEKQLQNTAIAVLEQYRRQK